MQRGRWKGVKCLPRSREWLEGSWDPQCPSRGPAKQAAGTGDAQEHPQLAAGFIGSSAPPHSSLRIARSLLRALQAGLPPSWDSQELGPWEEQGAGAL